MVETEGGADVADRVADRVADDVCRVTDDDDDDDDDARLEDTPDQGCTISDR